MEDTLPKLENKLYVFEENDLTEPSMMLAQFVRKCVECVKQGKGNTSENQWGSWYTLYVQIMIRDYLFLRWTTGKKNASASMTKRQKRCKWSASDFTFCNLYYFRNKENSNCLGLRTFCMNTYLEEWTKASSCHIVTKKTHPLWVLIQAQTRIPNFVQFELCALLVFHISNFFLCYSLISEWMQFSKIPTMIIFHLVIW